MTLEIMGLRVQWCRCSIVSERAALFTTSLLFFVRQYTLLCSVKKEKGRGKIRLCLLNFT